jgi:hypothetical protein
MGPLCFDFRRKESKMIRRRNELSETEVHSEESRLKLRGYTKAFGSSELGLKPKEYVIGEEMGFFGKEKKYRIAWNEE